LRESRREFISELTMTLGAVAAALGIPRPAESLVVRLGAASSVNGNQVSYPVPAVAVPDR
jgi:hypothetical protein